MRLKPHEFLNRVYAWWVERIPHDKYDEYQAELIELLPWQDSQSEAAIEAESESFMAMMQGRGR